MSKFMVTHSSRIIYRKEKRNYARVGHQVIGKKEVRKAERFRRIHEKWYENSIAWTNSTLRMCLTQQSKRTYKRRDCKNGHGTSCLILGNQKDYGRQDCTSGSPIWHFVPHFWQSKGLRKVELRIWATNSALCASTRQSKNEWMDCRTSLTNKWIANSALRMCLIRQSRNGKATMWGCSGTRTVSRDWRSKAQYRFA